MNAWHEWSRISSRIKALLTMGDFYFRSLMPNSSDSYGGYKDIYKECSEIFKIIGRFNSNYSESQSVIDPFLKENKSYVDPNTVRETEAIKKLIPALSALEAQVTYVLGETQLRISKTVEVAFAHLQRRIVADSTYRALWQQEKNETQFERLGGEHLLLHKIWASKCHSAGERTDLVLQEKIVDRADPLYMSADGIILTEWKIATPKNYQQMIDTAKKQLALYTNGSLYALDLTSCRYIVLISEKMLKINQSESESNSILYKVVNIAYSPDLVSKQAKKR